MCLRDVSGNGILRRRFISQTLDLGEVSESIMLNECNEVVNVLTLLQHIIPSFHILQK